jgi:hypothetical protein
MATAFRALCVAVNELESPSTIQLIHCQLTNASHNNITHNEHTHTTQTNKPRISVWIPLLRLQTSIVYIYTVNIYCIYVYVYIKVCIYCIYTHKHILLKTKEHTITMEDNKTRESPSQVDVIPICPPLKAKFLQPSIPNPYVDKSFPLCTLCGPYHI